MVRRRIAFLVCTIGALALAVVAAGVDIALGALTWAALGVFVLAPAADRLLWRQATPRSIFETRRAGLC